MQPLITRLLRSSMGVRFMGEKPRAGTYLQGMRELLGGRPAPRNHSSAHLLRVAHSAKIAAVRGSWEDLWLQSEVPVEGEM